MVEPLVAASCLAGRKNRSVEVVLVSATVPGQSRAGSLQSKYERRSGKGGILHAAGSPAQFEQTLSFQKPETDRC